MRSKMLLFTFWQCYEEGFTMKKGNKGKKVTLKQENEMGIHPGFRHRVVALNSDYVKVLPSHFSRGYLSTS